MKVNYRKNVKVKKRKDQRQREGKKNKENCLLRLQLFNDTASTSDVNSSNMIGKFL
jgi:hypothetical protein